MSRNIILLTKHKIFICRLTKNWNSGSYLQKQMVAVLAAVTELLQGEGKGETETDYFAALVIYISLKTFSLLNKIILRMTFFFKSPNYSLSMHI